MTDELWAAFSDPPGEARPRVWWHWMDGNVDIAGIDLDLEWMHRVGVRGVQMFEGGLPTPTVVPERLVHMSEPWRQAFAHAVRRTAELGLEFTIATSAGWSAAGAPWVDPEEAMKKLVWSTTSVVGGEPVRVELDL